MAKGKVNYKNMINPQSMPQHVAIIMDGNGRWARKRLMPRTMGHRAGMSSLKETVKACDELGIRFLTVYAFSTENWKRPLEEINYLMDLLVEFISKEIDELHEKKVRITIIGDRTQIPEQCQYEIDRAHNLTQDNTGLNFIVALNYGSRQEIVQAIKDITKDLLSQKLELDSINENTIKQYLSTKNIPDPDLLIRTAGEQRISNFLLWQIAYSELWFTECLWPDFDREELLKAIWSYQQRERRYGGLSDLKKDHKYV